MRRDGLTVTEKDRKHLLANWPLRESADCWAEVRLFDGQSGYECYLLAMNPEDEDEVYCILKGCSTEWTDWRLSEISRLYTASGTPLSTDRQYRPRRAYEIYKQLTRDDYASGRG